MKIRIVLSEAFLESLKQMKRKQDIVVSSSNYYLHIQNVNYVFSIMMRVLYQHSAINTDLLSGLLTLYFDSKRTHFRLLDPF